METLIFAAIRKKSTELESPLLAVNCTTDHVHVAVCIPPKLAAADWLGQVKGYSSYEVNAMFPNLETRFRWQKHYGLLTFGLKNQSFVTDYVNRQKEHHTNSTTIPHLERTDGVD